MNNIGEVIGKELWKIYRIKYPLLSEEDLFSIIWKDIIQTKADNSSISQQH